MEIEIQGVERKCSLHFDHLVASLNEFRHESLFCDVTIKVEGAEFGAHKYVLAAASKYFKNMFTNPFLESKSGIVNFSQTSPIIVRNCIDFIYTGIVVITKDNIEELLDASELMALDDLSKLCVAFLAESVEVGNCARVIALSNLYRKKSLDAPLQKLILENFDEVVMSEDFMSLDSDALAHCLKLLQDGGRDLEKQKWSAILFWVKHNLDNREIFFPQLFEILNLSLIAKSFTREVILEEELVKKSPVCLLLVAQLHTDEEIELPPPRKRPKATSELVVCKRDSQVIVKYESVEKRWSPVARFPGQLHEQAQLVMHDDVLYVGAGFKLYQYANNVWRSGCTDKAVNRMYSPCNGPCHCNFSCPHNSATYIFNRCIVCGDCIFMLTVNSIIELNIMTSKLLRHSVGIDLGKNFFATASEKKIYVCGGTGTEFKAVEIDLETKYRSRLCNMSFPKETGYAFMHDGKVYAFGGQTYPAKVECYLPNQDIWLVATQVEIPRAPTQIFFSDKLYLVLNTVAPTQLQVTPVALYKLTRLSQPTGNVKKVEAICSPSSVS